MTTEDQSMAAAAPLNVFGSVFDNRALFSQYQLQSRGGAPTAMMIDPGLQQFSQAQSANPSQQGSMSEQEINAPEVLPANEARPQPAPAMTRTLPSRDTDASTFDDAYVQFIMYCNPSVPLDTDTAELRKGFRLMPKSDGNCFDTYTLFKLIKKLEAKEIETWSALVIELGVEPPDPSKNQSTQKVQQFAVRMKRWLHAFHIDAFFHYCLGKPTVYSTEVPPAEDSISDIIRDGVAPEEDLALRALLPEWRPKRGRRKLEGADLDQSTPSKRTQRGASLNAEDLPTSHGLFTSQPQSAFPWSGQSARDNAWATAHCAIIPKTGQATTPQQPFPGQQTFWMDVPDGTPSTPYPQSAITPRHSHSTYEHSDTPQSAHPGSARPRKRHGPTVSAAWSSGGSGGNGKLPRGRPPTNRSVVAGPFSTFPVNPPSRPSATKSTGTPSQTPHPDQRTPTPIGDGVRHAQHPASQPPPSAPVTAGPIQTPVRKPSKLSLQVPQHAGGPVRLATPPPKVLVNGEDGKPEDPNSYRRHERRTSADFFASVEDDPSELGYESEEETRGDKIDWKRRAMVLGRKLNEMEAELKAIKRRVLEAVM